MDFTEIIDIKEDSDEGESDFDRKTRRSSILKPSIRRSEHEENNDFTTKSSRRVSFASSNFIKPFATDPDKNTIWDQTYEEEVSHIDSTKSLSGKSEILNISTIRTPQHVMETNIVKPRIPFLPLDVEEYSINKENIFISTEGVENVTKCSVNMELTEVVSEKIYVSSSTVVSSEICKHSESDLEFTNILHNDIIQSKQNLSYKQKQNCLQSVDHESQDMEITEVIEDPCIYENQCSLQGYDNIKNKSLNQTLFFKNDEEDMEFTAPFLPPERLNIQEFQELQTENKMTKFLNHVVQNKENINFSKLQNNIDKENKIEGIVSVKNVEIESSKFSKRITAIHVQGKEDSERVNDISKSADFYKNNESNMELTLGLPSSQTMKTAKETIACLNRTLLNDNNESNMELTSVLPSSQTMKTAEEIRASLNRTVLNDNNESNMELTLGLPSSQTMKTAEETRACLNRTILDNNDESSMEFTSVLPSSQILTTVKESEEASKSKVYFNEKPGVVEQRENACELNYSEPIIDCEDIDPSKILLQNEIEKTENVTKEYTIYSENEQKSQDSILNDEINNSVERCHINVEESGKEIAENVEETSISSNRQTIYVSNDSNSADITSTQHEEVKEIEDINCSQSEQISKEEKLVEKCKSSTITEQSILIKDNPLKENISFGEPMDIDSFPRVQKNQSYSLDKQIQIESSDQLEKSGIHFLDRSKSKPNQKTTSDLKTNVLYTASPKINVGISKFDTTDYHQFGLTPTRYGINYANYSSCIDDTQQLIHATVPKKNESDKLDYCETVVDEIDHNQRADTTPVSMLEDSKLLWDIIQNGKDVENIDNVLKESDVNLVSETSAMEMNSTLDHNYTLRCSNFLNNIKKFLTLPSEDEDERKNRQIRQKKIDARSELIRQNKKKINEKCRILLSQVESVNLREILKEIQEESEKRRISLEANSSENNDPILNVVVPKSIYERVCEVADRCNGQWTLNKSQSKEEEGRYSFSTLNNTINFLVNIYPDTGVVHNISTSVNNLDGVLVLRYYNAKVFEYKMTKENLLSALGVNYEIHTLLDYVSMTMEEISNFNKEFTELRDKYRTSYKFKMDSNFNVVFKILSVRYNMWWEIIVKMSVFNIGHQESVSARHVMGERLNENDIKAIAHNTLGGHTFLRNFIRNVEEYKERMIKKAKFKAGAQY